jgi:cholesterol oxidase
MPDPSNDPGTPVAGTPAPAKLTFTEEMKGFVTREETPSRPAAGLPQTVGETDYELGFQRGEQSNGDLMFHLDITVADVFDFVATPGTTSAAAGWVRSSGFGGQLPVEQGWFNLFVDQGTPTLKHMLYRLFFSDSSGKPLTLSGFKDIHNDPGFEVWHDTTTLFTRIFEGHVQKDGEAQATVIASGILKLDMLDFLHQLSTFRVEAPTELEKVSALSHFGIFFLGNLWEVYGSKLTGSGE